MGHHGQLLTLRYPLIESEKQWFDQRSSHCHKEKDSRKKSRTSKKSDGVRRTSKFQDMFIVTSPSEGLNRRDNIIQLEKQRQETSVSSSSLSPEEASLSSGGSPDSTSMMSPEELFCNEFVDEDLELAISDPEQHDLFKEAFRAALQCINSPYYAQLEKNLALDDATFLHHEIHGSDIVGTPMSSSVISSKSEPVMTSREQQVNPRDFQWKLVRTLRHAFNGLVSEEEFRQYWSQFVTESSFDSHYPCDLTLRALEERKRAIPHHPYCRRDQFATHDEYELWMQNETETVDRLIEAALEVRKNKVNIAMHVDLRNVVFFSGIKKVGTELRLRTAGEYVGDWVPCTEYDADTGCYLFDWDGRPEFDRHYNERIGRERIEFVHKKNFLGKSAVAGFFDVNLNSILRILQSPLPRNWSQGVFEKRVEIKNTKGKVVGEADVSVLVKFHFFPSTSSRRTASLSRHEQQGPSHVEDYHRLYEILVSRIVKMHRQNRTSGETTVLNFYERFILEEFALIFGIHEVFRRITMLHALAPRLDLITPFSDQIMRDIQFIHIAIDMDNFTVTLEDRQRLKQVMQVLDDKLFNLLSNFKKYFPQNRPKGAFATFFEIWWMIRTQQDSFDDDESSGDMDQGTLIVLCRNMVRKAICSDYASIVEAISSFDRMIHKDQSIADKRKSKSFIGIEKDIPKREDVLPGSVLSQVCRIVQSRIDETFRFSGVFPKDVRYELVSLRIYYELLRADVERFLSSKGDPSNLPPFDILQISSDISQLNKTIRFNFEDYESKLDFEFLDLEDMAREQVPRWMKELRERLMMYKDESIALDKYDEKAGVPHSTSVVDLFSASNQMLEFIRGLDFVTADILQSFICIVCDVTVEYARAMEDRCLVHLNERRPAASISAEDSDDIVIDFAAMRKEVLKDQSTNGSLELPPLIVTQQFIVKINNIEAARQQLNRIIEAVEDTTNEFFDMEVDDDDESDEDMTIDTDLTEADAATDDSSVRMDSCETLKKTTFRALNSMLDEAVVVLATQYQPFVHNCLENLVSIVYNQRDLSEKHVQTKYQEQIDQMLDEQLLDPVFTPSFCALNERMYYDLFLRVLKRIYATMLREMESMILPIRDFVNQQKTVRYLTFPQVYVLKSSIVPLFIFFQGGEEEHGLSKEWLKEETRWVAQIMKIYDRPTERLIAFYKKRFVDNKEEGDSGDMGSRVSSMVGQQTHQPPSPPTSALEERAARVIERKLPNVRDILEEEKRGALRGLELRTKMHSFSSVASVDSTMGSTAVPSRVPPEDTTATSHARQRRRKACIDCVSPIHIFLIIAARAPRDQTAAKFVAEYKNVVLGRSLHQHLGLDPAQSVFETFSCFDHRMMPGRATITSVYLMFSRLKLTGTGYSTKKQNLVRLVEVDDIRKSTSLMGKGFIIRSTPTAGVDRKERTMKLYFSRNATRERFYHVLAENAKAAGNKLFEGRRIVDQLHDEPVQATDLTTMAKLPLAQRNSIDRAAMEDEVRQQFGIDRSQILVDRFKCNFKDQPGFLFVFTECMCFRGTLDPTERLTIRFSEVMRVEKSGFTHIRIDMSDGTRFEFGKFSSRSKAFGVIFSQWDALIERSSSASFATSHVTSVSGTSSIVSGARSARSAVSNIIRQRRKSIVNRLSPQRRKSLPASVAQAAITDEDQDHFYKAFDSVEPDELLVAKFDRINYGSATGQPGTLYISTRHICFEPSIMSSDRWAAIATGDVREVRSKRSRMLVGRTMKLKLRNGSKVKFHIRGNRPEVIELVKKMVPAHAAGFVE